MNTYYETLKKGLTEKFGNKDQPSSFRRELQSVKQSDGETLEEFGQQIIFLVIEGHPQAKKETTGDHCENILQRMQGPCSC